MKTLLVSVGLTASLATTLAMGEEPGEQFTRPLGFPLVSTAVVDVQGELGPTPITQRGHHENVVCYLWPTPEAIVTFMSQGEGLSGRFRMRWLAGTVPQECRAPAPAAARRLKLEVAGLRLGMSKQDFETVLGTLAPLPGGRVGATFERSEPMDNAAHPLAIGNILYITIVVGGTFVQDRLVDLEIWKTMST